MGGRGWRRAGRGPRGWLRETRGFRGWFVKQGNVAMPAKKFLQRLVLTIIGLAREL